MHLESYWDHTKVVVRKLELKIEYVSTGKMGLLHFSHPMTKGIATAALQRDHEEADEHY